MQNARDCDISELLSLWCIATFLQDCPYGIVTSIEFKIKLGGIGVVSLPLLMASLFEYSLTPVLFLYAH